MPVSGYEMSGVLYVSMSMWGVTADGRGAKGVKIPDLDTFIRRMI